VEKTYLCHLDFIKLYNGEDETYPEIATVCHQNKPLTLRSSGNFMFVKFRADTSVQGLGFYANYTTKPTSECGGKYVMDKASIMSPNYPQNYDINSTCGYEIEVGEGHMISLKFEDFDLFEPNIICSFNNNSYVKVYDGPSKDYPLLAKICGKKAPNHTLLSTTNKLYVELVTDTVTVAKGFLAKYRQVSVCIFVSFISSLGNLSELWCADRNRHHRHHTNKSSRLGLRRDQLFLDHSS
jgi:cubilin